MDELEYLSNNLGLKTHKQIGRKLNRTATAVKFKAFREKFTYYDNFYSYKLLAKELGVCRTTLRNYVSRGLLKGHKANWRSLYGFQPMIFTEKDILEFLKNCNGQFVHRTIPNLYFKNIYNQYHEIRR